MPQDFIGSVTNELNALVSQGGPVFLATGNQILTAIGIIMLVLYGVRWAIHSASRHHPEFPYGEVIHFFGMFLLAEALLRYYNAPLPFTNSSFHQLLPAAAADLAKTIDLGTVSTLLQHIKAIVEGTERPSVFNPLELVMFVLLLVNMLVAEGLVFAASILGFIGIGLGSLMGPLFIPWLVVPKVSWLFWNWFSFMLQYSFYQVIASALVWVWANVLVTFLDNSFHGDYSLSHVMSLIVPMAVLNIGMFYSIFRIPAFVQDLFKGAAASGAGFASSVATSVKGAFA
jgi:TrbL/VirB6 plasmid conjugal transfer protein